MAQEYEGINEARYKALAIDREPYLTRGRRVSRLTIPTLLPEETILQHELPKPWQSMGARCVNTLASKLLLALFPVNLAFFRLQVDESVYMENPEAEANRTEIEETLAGIEKVLATDIELDSVRVKAFEVLRQSLVTGNVLLHLPSNGRRPRVFRLDAFVCDRDPRGNLIEIVTKETVAPVLLSKETKEAIGYHDDTFGSGVNSAAGTGQKGCDIYTRCVLTDEGWVETQEAKGAYIPNSRIEHGTDIPYICPRMIAEDGSSYGRSICEEYEGDFRVLEVLHQSVAKGALASARLIPLVNPQGRTNISDLQKAKDGQFVQGRPEDVQFLQTQKHADLSVAAGQIQTIERRLAQVFLINTPRDAERVTAQEVRLLASELESSLGGLFSLLSEEFQQPMVETYLARAQAAGRIEEIPDWVSVSISTGLSAIGRGHDRARLEGYLRDITQLGPEAMRYINMPTLLRQLATADGIDTTELLRTEEEIQAQMQQAQLAESVNKLAPTAMREFPDEVREAMAAAQPRLA
tara:strand:- start:9949 stop:11517 length:1569 start_codon:yes stop_codon:yes gene_type:complete